MKRILSALLVSLIIFSACNKESTPAPTPAPLTVEELLTQKTWKADEVRSQFSNNTTTYYKRGGASNSVNYDSDSIKFNTNNTGIYYFNGTINTTTWNFTNPEKTKMVIVINYATPLTINWEYVNVVTGSLKYTQYSSFNGLSYLASGTRVPN